MTLRQFVRRPVAVLTVLACLIGLASAAGTGPATASAGAVRPGLGRHAGGEFVGFYVTRDGHEVYCLIPRRSTPATVSLRTVGRYPGLGAAASGALAYALARWGDARTRDAAAVESQVVNTLAGNHRDVARRNRSLPASLRRRITAHVAEARALRGPYRLQLTTPSAPLPGGSGSGRLRLVSAAGHAVPGVRISLRATANARVPAAVRTDRRGTGTFRYDVRDVGEVRVSAAAGLPATAMRISDPRPGQQRLATAAASVRVHAAASFRGVAGGFRHRYSCSSECAGRPTVVLTACAPASRMASRIVYRAGGRQLVREFAADRRRRCADTTLVVADGVTITGSWQFRTARGWSRPMAASGTFLVDCPAPPAVTVGLTADCTRVTLTAGLALAGGSVPGGTRPAVLVVAGARTARIAADARGAAVWSLTAACGAHLRLRFTSGVQRRDGGWNYGRPVSIVTP